MNQQAQNIAALTLGIACILFGLARDELGWAPVGFGALSTPGLLRITVGTAAGTVKIEKGD